MMDKRIIYYKDELNDEFADDTISAIPIGKSYRYLREKITERFLRFFWYRLIAFPIAFLYLKLHFHHTIINRSVIRKARKEKKLSKGFYVYGNHTQQVADALIPTFVCFPKAVNVIVHPNNVSMPVLGKINPYLGALPLPDNIEATKNFLQAITYKINHGNGITIYPEAHIWPFYTDIRPFSDASFRYPAKLTVPVFCFTNTYQKRRFSNKPKLVTYVDGPFYSDMTLPVKERKSRLRDDIYRIMKERARNNSVVMIEYKKREETTEND